MRPKICARVAPKARAAVTRPGGTECTAAMPLGTTMKKASTLAKITFWATPMPNISTNTGRNTDFGTDISNCSGPPSVRSSRRLSPIRKPTSSPSGTTIAKASRHSVAVMRTSARKSASCSSRQRMPATFDSGGSTSGSASRARAAPSQASARAATISSCPPRTRHAAVADISGSVGGRYFAGGWKSLEKIASGSALARSGMSQARAASARPLAIHALSMRPSGDSCLITCS